MGKITDYAAAFGAIEAKVMPKTQRLTAAMLTRNYSTIPHVTHNDNLDISALEALRLEVNAEGKGTKLTALHLILKALPIVLAQHPQFNASLDEESGEIVYKKYFNMGVAIDSPRGLLVGVINDCDKKTVFEISESLSALTEKARMRGLSVQEMQGGCMSVSSLGALGGTSFTPIINAPEVAILGLTRAFDMPIKTAEGGLAWRRVLPVSLSYDHRLINGADAARWVASLAAVLAVPEQLLD